MRAAVSAHAYFKQKTEDHVLHDGKFDEYGLESLFESLKEGLAVVSIELEGSDDPQTIFETLNSRGVDLTPGDLMRNFIFQRAKGMGQTDSELVVNKLYEKHWQPLDRAFWNQVASRGRQSRSRLDWMLTDHLSMHIGNLVSVEQLFESYRRWILNEHPFSTILAELASITATATIEKSLFDQERGDPLGDFGRFADAFDVSTAMPLVVYLATEEIVGEALQRALAVLKSYILRRDICGLTTKNYNRFFVGIIGHLRAVVTDRIDALIVYLSSRQSDIDRWPDDDEWRRGWMGRDQYNGARQPRLRYIFEQIEQVKRSSLNEDIEIKSALTIEHIMPQRWKAEWPILGFEHLEDDDADVERLARYIERDGAINKLGNLTLLTHPLNSTVSNGPFSVKMPAVRSHSSLTINRELHIFEDWNEETIAKRGASLFQTAQKIWAGPERPQGSSAPSNVKSDLIAQQRASLPPDGTVCRFTYAGQLYEGRIVERALVVEGFESRFGSLSSASGTITKTSRNGWDDWYLRNEHGGWILANDWRNRQHA